jgi:hypothetical protein
MLDAALTTNARGLLIPKIVDGDVVLDESGSYPLLSTLATDKGRYLLDPTGQQGTRLGQVVQDVRSTGSELVACAQDAGQQCERDVTTGVSNVRATASRPRPGRWDLRLAWDSPRGPQARAVEV